MLLPTILSDEKLSRAARSERTRDLFACLDADPPAERKAELREQIVSLNLRVAKAVAARYRGRGVDEEDLQQAASHGLVKASLRFDPAQGKDFLTYAVPTIRGEVQRYFRDRGWTVRPPRRVQELQWRVNASIDRLAGELGREPNEAEVIDDLDITYTEYAEAVTAFGCFHPPSLDQPVSESESLLFADAIAAQPRDLDAVEARVMLEPLLDRLTADERRLLHLRFVEDRTQQQIGEEYGATQAQVSRWLSSILNRMRSECGGRDGALLAG